MSATVKHLIIAPNGTELRFNKSRPFGFAVVGADELGAWRFVRFAKTEVLARKTRDEWSREARGALAVVEVVFE